MMKYFGIILSIRIQHFQLKDLISTKQAWNEQLVNNVNDKLIYLRSTIIKNEIPGNENPNKRVDIIEKIHPPL